jgi:hypothetical protein
MYKSMVYIAGPLTSNPAQGLRNACIVGDFLWSYGLIPFVPHTSILWQMTTAAGSKRPYEDWMEWCLYMVGRCDSLVRLPGKSKGVDAEYNRAMSAGLPVFTSILQFAGSCRLFPIPSPEILLQREPALRDIFPDDFTSCPNH